MVDNSDAAIYSRRMRRFARFEPLAHAIHGAVGTRAAVLDGEVVCLDADGRPDFAALLVFRP